MALGTISAVFFFSIDAISLKDATCSFDQKDVC
jgi:hypothetical protein